MDSADDQQADDLGPSLPPNVAAHLGNRLRSFYDNLMVEPVPDHLARLIEQYDKKGDGTHGK